MKTAKQKESWTLEEQTNAARENTRKAVEHLAKYDRGRAVLKNLLTFLMDGGTGLDMFNQNAVLIILRHAFNEIPASSKDIIAEALGIDLSNERERIEAKAEILNALKVAENFMSGFEDDDSQENINEDLRTIRSAVAKAKGGA